jgi:hypothetical protein
LPNGYSWDVDPAVAVGVAAGDDLLGDGVADGDVLGDVLEDAVAEGDGLPDTTAAEPGSVIPRVKPTEARAVVPAPRASRRRFGQREAGKRVMGRYLSDRGLHGSLEFPVRYLKIPST